MFHSFWTILMITAENKRIMNFDNYSSPSTVENIILGIISIIYDSGNYYYTYTSNDSI